jgi:hypothetical protein
MEYPIFYIHVEPYIVVVEKLGYISQLLTRYYYCNLSCTEHVIIFCFIQPII